MKDVTTASSHRTPGATTSSEHHSLYFLLHLHPKAVKEKNQAQHLAMKDEFIRIKVARQIGNQVITVNLGKKVKC